MADSLWIISQMEKKGNYQKDSRSSKRSHQIKEWLPKRANCHGVVKYRVNMPTPMIDYIERHQETYTEIIP
jgi:hypothetical protein